ncbi:MAG: type II secretion system protein GspC [Steroidobacteraceae bacterium]
MCLAALIAVELARIGLSFAGGTPLKPVSASRPVQPVAAHAPVDVNRLVAAHLFGVAEAQEADLDPADAPPSSSNLTLTGTIATQDPKRGVAIISDGGPSKVYSIGDRVGGATVHSVYLDRVLLARDGNLESLMLPRQLEGGPAGPPPGPPPRSYADDGHGGFSVAENLRRRVQAEPGLLNEIMRTVPSYDNKAGKLRGFRAYPGRNRLIFSKLGLKPGDIVTGINGTPLDDPQRSQEVLNTLSSSDRATITVERGGQKQDITLNIANVAQQASRELEIDAGAAPPQPPAQTAPAEEDTNE